MASKRISRLIKILTGALADAEDEIFQLDGRLERLVHFWALVIRQFIRHRCLARAAGLSYSTLLALIPLIAVALSVTSTLLKQQDVNALSQFVEKAVASLTPPAAVGTNSAASNTNAVRVATTNGLAVAGAAGGEVDTNSPAAAPATNAPPAGEPIVTPNTQKEIALWIHDLVQKTSNGALGVTGMIILIFTAISLLRGIEETFNDMWGVTRGRNWLRQIMLYWTTITLGPLLLVVALGLTGSVYFQQTRTFLAASPFLAPLLNHALPILIISLMLALFYKVTPNTKVAWSAAFIGGAVAGAAWHFYNELGFLLVGRAANASRFYGGLVSVVLLMGGLYIVWVILIFGAQIAYAVQNRAAYLQDRLADNVNQRGREFVALRLMTRLGERFQSALPPATVFQLSTELGIPSRLTQSVLRMLTHKQLVMEIVGAEAGFAPARPLDAINAYDILQAMRTGTGQELPLREEPGLAEIYGEFARIEQAERAAAGAITLRLLVNRLPPAAALPEPATSELQPAITVTTLMPPAEGANLSGPVNVVEAAETVAEPVPLAEVDLKTPVPDKVPPPREVARPSETDFPL